MKAIKLRCEYLNDPIGIDITDPVLSWQCDGGVRQTAYRIVARSSLGTLFDSGKVSSDSMKASYPEPLRSRERVEWTLTLWDENGLEGESSSACFEMGLLDKSDWCAEWISGDYRPSPSRRYPVDCFRREFSASDIKKARIYATACGLYELSLNGSRVGDFVLAPGHTDYRKRVQYQTYDVTELVRGGANVIEAELADGWYRGSCGAWGLRNQYGRETKLLVQLEIEKNDGTREVIATDSSWSWSCDGAIRFADNKDGETVDASLSPSYSGRARVTGHKVVPTASNNVPVREKEIFTDPILITTPSGRSVLDFGQNIAGYIGFTLEAKAGQTLYLRFGEMLDKDGEFTQKNIQCATKKRQTPLQQIRYTAREGHNEYKTRFAVFGFRYALVEGDIAWRVGDFRAIAVYSDMESTISFSSSHPLINKFVENTRWSAKNNHLDVPTDCPTRERHGWTGDAQLFSKTACYFFDYSAFARKYVRMLADGQKPSGKVPQIVPEGGVDFYMTPMDGSAGWSDAAVIIPYNVWKLLGDDRIITDNLEVMKRYADYTISKIGKWYPTAVPTGALREGKRYVLNYGQAYGEWAEPADVRAMHWTDFITPKPEVSTAYASYVLSLMAEICECFHDSSRDRYRAYSKKIREGYVSLTKGKKYPLDTDRQSRLVRPLYFDLLDAEQTEYAKKRLLKALDNYSWRLGTGFLSTPFILYVLQDMDIEYAYRLLENEQMPGWLFMPKMGADTIWESWEGTEAQGGVASLNHYSKGAVCEWLFSAMCGINIAGERHFRIEPRVGGSLTFAECSYDSVYGRISSSWHRTKEETVYEISVPSNTTATFILDSEEHILTPGCHTFRTTCKT